MTLYSESNPSPDALLGSVLKPAQRNYPTTDSSTCRETDGTRRRNVGRERVQRNNQSRDRGGYCEYSHSSRSPADATNDARKNSNPWRSRRKAKTGCHQKTKSLPRRERGSLTQHLLWRRRSREQRRPANVSPKKLQRVRRRVLQRRKLRRRSDPR